MKLQCARFKNDNSPLCNISRLLGGGNVTNHTLYREILTLLDQYEESIYSEWCDSLEEACLINMNLPLLSRHPSTGLISVNFNPKVFDVMSLQNKSACWANCSPSLKPGTLKYKS